MGWVGHRGQAVGQGHGAGYDAFDCGRDASGGHAHHAWGVPAGRGRWASEVTVGAPHSSTGTEHPGPGTRPRAPSVPEHALRGFSRSSPVPRPSLLQGRPLQGAGVQQALEAAPVWPFQEAQFSQDSRQVGSTTLRDHKAQLRPSPAQGPCWPRLQAEACCSPVGGPIELGVHHGRVHAGPVRGGRQVVLVDAVFQTIRDPT